MSLILLLTSPRTGGITLTHEIKNKFIDHECLWECFGPSNTKSELENTLRYCSLHDVIVKVNPQQTIYAYGGIGIIEDLCHKADHIYYTTRESIVDQSKSLYKAYCTNEYGSERKVRLSRGIKYKSPTINVDFQKYYKIMGNLLEEWKYIARLYDIYPGEVICLEHRNTPYIYNKEYILENEWFDDEAKVLRVVEDFNQLRKMSRLFLDKPTHTII